MSSDTIHNSFPEGLKPFVKGIISKKSRPLKDMLKEVLDKLENAFVVGELVKFNVKHNGNSIEGKIIKASIDTVTLLPLVESKTSNLKTMKESPNSLHKPQSVTYSVRLLNKNEVITKVPGPDLQRLYPIPSRKALRSYMKDIINAKHNDSKRYLQQTIDLTVVSNKSPSSLSAKKSASHNILDSVPLNLNKRKKADKINGCEGKRMKKEDTILEAHVVLKRIDEKETKVKNTGSSKKLKQMTLLDMTKKIAPPTENNKEPVMKITPLATSLANAVLDSNRQETAVKEEKVLKLHPLPVPQLFATPDDFENEWIGAVAMIVQFMATYREVLFLPNISSLTIDSLIKGIASGSQGFTLLNNILLCLLRVIVNPENDQSKGINSLSEVPISIYTASEVARLYFQENQAIISHLSDDQLMQLYSKEFHHLAPYDKLNVLSILCSEALESESVCDLVLKKQNRVQDLFEQIGRKRQQKVQQILLEMKENTSSTANESLPEEDFSKTSSTGKSLPGEDFSKTSCTGKSLPGEDFSETSSSESELSKNDIEYNRGGRFRQRRQELSRIQLERRKAEEEKQQRYELTKELLSDYRLKLTYQESLKEKKKLRRLEPLGKDRDSACYWAIGYPALTLLIEKRETTESKCLSTDYMSCEKSRWYTYESKSELAILAHSLSLDIDSERLLRHNIYRLMKRIKSPQINEGNVPELEFCDGDVDLMEALREELLDVEFTLTNGGLGYFKNRDAWIDVVQNAKTCSDFRTCILTLYESVYPQFISGALSISGSIGITMTKTFNLTAWKETVKNCTLFSKMHMMLAVLSSCIRWEKLTKNNCNVCRKKTGDDLLLCDSCNKGFHLTCLRPSLSEVPQGDWFCRSCILKQSKENEPSPCTIEKNKENDMLKEMKGTIGCLQCKSLDGEVAICVRCFNGFHKECHIPPLKYFPRGPWVCGRCTKKHGSFISYSKMLKMH